MGLNGRKDLILRDNSTVVNIMFRGFFLVSEGKCTYVYVKENFPR